MSIRGCHSIISPGFSTERRRALLVFAFLCIGLLTGTGALAQPAAPLPNPPGFEQPAGLAAGGFDFFTRTQAGVKFTNNVRLDPTMTSDAKTLFAIDGVARSHWEQHQLAATLSYLNMTAVDTPDEGSEAFSGTLSGRFDFSKTLNLKLGLLSQESIVDKNDPMQFSGNLNGTTHTDTVEAGLEYDDKSHFVNLLFRNLDISNETNVDVSVLQRVQAQDREETNLTLQLGKHYGWGKAYLFGGPQAVTYTGSAVILPEDRDSKGGRLGVGVEFRHGKWEGIGRFIFFTQYFDAPTIPDVGSVVGMVQLVYAVTDQWAVSGLAQRVFDETNITSSGGLFTNLLAVGARYTPVENVYIKMGPALRHYEIAGTSMLADSYSLDATAAWQVTKRLEVLVDATVSDQTVNDPLLANLEYGEKSVTVSMVLTF